MTIEKTYKIFSSKCRSKRLHCYNRWTNFFDPPVKNGLTTYDNIKKIAIGQGDYYITGCLLEYPYFKEHYKVIVAD